VAAHLFFAFPHQWGLCFVNALRILRRGFLPKMPRSAVSGQKSSFLEIHYGACLPLDREWKPGWFVRYGRAPWAIGEIITVHVAPVSSLSSHRNLEITNFARLSRSCTLCFLIAEMYLDDSLWRSKGLLVLHHGSYAL